MAGPGCRGRCPPEDAEQEAGDERGRERAGPDDGGFERGEVAEHRGHGAQPGPAVVAGARRGGRAAAVARRRLQAAAGGGRGGQQQRQQQRGREQRQRGGGGAHPARSGCPGSGRAAPSPGRQRRPARPGPRPPRGAASRRSRRRGPAAGQSRGRAGASAGSAPGAPLGLAAASGPAAAGAGAAPWLSTNSSYQRGSKGKGLGGPYEGIWLFNLEESDINREESEDRAHRGLQRLGRGSSDLFSVWLETGLKRSWNWVLGGLGWILGRGFSPKGGERWNRLPRGGITAPSLRELKQHLDNSLRHRVGQFASPVQSRELDFDDYSGSPPQNSPFL